MRGSLPVGPELDSDQMSNYPPGMTRADYAHVHGDEDEELSDCCGSEIINTDICSMCKEHCEPFEREPLEPEYDNNEE